jgi:hypothetical protein
MKIEILPDTLLNGRFLHCQPVEGGPIVKAQILPSDRELTPTFKVAVVCGARRPCSKCELRMNAGSEDDHCQYWKGDSLGGYQIIGPGMDKKSDRGYKGA